jgi:hypothetical protein
VHNRTDSPQAKTQPPKKQVQRAKAKIQPKKQGAHAKAKTQPPQKQGKRQRDSGQNNQSIEVGELAHFLAREIEVGEYGEPGTSADNPIKKSKPTMEDLIDIAAIRKANRNRGVNIDDGFDRDNIPTGCMDGGFNNSGGYRQWSQKQQQQQIVQQQHQQIIRQHQLDIAAEQFEVQHQLDIAAERQQDIKSTAPAGGSVANQWHCAACTFANGDMSALTCSICTTPREQNNQTVGNGPPQSGVFDLTSDGPAEQPSDDGFDDRFDPEKELYVLTSTFETQ